MSLINSHVDPQNPRFEIEALLHLHGPARVIRALVLAMAGRRRPNLDVNNLPNHLRRDVGLEVHPPSPKIPDLMR